MYFLLFAFTVNYAWKFTLKLISSVKTSLLSYKLNADQQAEVNVSKDRYLL